MYKERNRFLNLIILLFFTHGFMYFITGDIYNEDNPVKLVKYLLLTLFILNILPSLRFISRNDFVILPFAAYFVCTALLYLSLNIQLLAVFMFMFPLFFFFLNKNMSFSVFVKIIKTTLWLALCFALIEFSFYQDLSVRFSSTGFRSISIFVNPNNFGIFVALSLALIVGDSYRYKSSRVVVYWCIAAICIALSGSMTAAGVYIFLLAAHVLKVINESLRTYKLKKKYILILTTFFCAVILISINNLDGILRKTDAVGMDNVNARLDYLSAFFSSISENFLYPQLISNSLYADNAFIYSWISVGVIGALLYFVLIITMVSISLRFNNKKYSLFFISTALAAMTTNIFNIWPIAYMFWACVGYSLITERNFMKRSDEA